LLFINIFLTYQFNSDKIRTPSISFDVP